MPQQKAKELIEKYGKEVALDIANMIFQEHYNYADSRTLWRGDFKEYYTNADKCKYWSEISLEIERVIQHQSS